METLRRAPGAARAVASVVEVVPTAAGALYPLLPQLSDLDRKPLHGFLELPGLRIQGQGWRRRYYRRPVKNLSKQPLQGRKMGPNGGVLAPDGQQLVEELLGNIPAEADDLVQVVLV